MTSVRAIRVVAAYFSCRVTQPRHDFLELPNLFGTASTLPAGAAYFSHAVPEAESQALVERFETLPFKPFAFHGYLGNRRVVSFGWRYDYAGRALREADAIPEFLLPLRRTAASLAGVEAKGLQQALVTEYAKGAGIGWHRDKPMFEDVVAFSFVSACVLRFRREHDAGWERTSLRVEPGSAYLLRGPSRRVWEHSIPAVQALRYSVTFRNFSPVKAPRPARR
jgi:alkylated DNA repair dioxygenase AlkB